MTDWKSCYTCRDYREHRADALAGPMADKAIRENRDAEDVVDDFMAAAHQRHLAGTPLRVGGPTRVTDPTIGRVVALTNVVTPPPPPEVTHPCLHNQHRWAWLTSGGQACGRCGVIR